MENIYQLKITQRKKKQKKNLRRENNVPKWSHYEVMQQYWFTAILQVTVLKSPISVCKSFKNLLKLISQLNLSPFIKEYADKTELEPSVKSLYRRNSKLSLCGQLLLLETQKTARRHKTFCVAIQKGSATTRSQIDNNNHGHSKAKIVRGIISIQLEREKLQRSSCT